MEFSRISDPFVLFCRNRISDSETARASFCRNVRTCARARGSLMPGGAVGRASRHRSACSFAVLSKSRQHPPRPWARGSGGSRRSSSFCMACCDLPRSRSMPAASMPARRRATCRAARAAPLNTACTSATAAALSCALLAWWSASRRSCSWSTSQLGRSMFLYRLMVYTLRGRLVGSLCASVAALSTALTLDTVRCPAGSDLRPRSMSAASLCCARWSETSGMRTAGGAFGLGAACSALGGNVMRALTAR